MTSSIQIIGCNAHSSTVSFALQAGIGRIRGVAGINQVAGGAKVNDDIYHELKIDFDNIHRVGDCLAPRTTENAIYEGMLVGRELFDDSKYIEPGELEEWNG